MDAITVGFREASDRDLVEQYSYGDQEAFAEVYRRFEGMVFNVALRLSGDPVEAEDLSQEIFLRVHRHLSGFRGRSSLKTWIYRVALNCCRSRLSRRRRWAPLWLDDPEPALEKAVDPHRGPESRAIGRDAARRLGELIVQLPIKYREAVVLRDVEDLSYDEIATILKVRIGTVRSRIARGRNQIREALEEEQQ